MILNILFCIYFTDLMFFLTLFVCIFINSQQPLCDCGTCTYVLSYLFLWVLTGRLSHLWVFLSKRCICLSLLETEPPTTSTWSLLRSQFTDWTDVSALIIYLPSTTRGLPIFAVLILESCLHLRAERSLPSSRYSTVERDPSRELIPPTTMMPCRERGR